MRLRHRVIELDTARPFKIATGAASRYPFVIAEISHDAATGLGEAAASRRVTGESVETVSTFLDEAAKDVAELQPGDWTGFLARLHAKARGSPTARAALDVALHDLVGKLEGRPIHALHGLRPGRLETTMTVSLDEPAVMADEAREYAARGFRCIKVKLGGGEADAARAVAVRDAVPQARLRADANTRWSRSDAERLLPLLADLGFEFVEQPFPAEDVAGFAALSRASPLMLYADESVLDVQDVLRLREAGFRGGVNLKLMKTGGILPALDAIREAKSAGFAVQMGCNVETGIGITAAAHLLSLLDAADLDGNLLLASDPFGGVRPARGWLETPMGPGLGLRPPPAADGPRGA